MKKTIFFGVAVLLILAFVISGCDNLFSPPNITDKLNNQEIPLKERVPVESLESNLAKALWHQVDAIGSILETVEKYVDIPEQDISRAAGGNTIDLEKIGQYLPSDLSTLKRAKDKPANAGRATGDEDEIITLQDELDEIITSFDDEMCLLVPQLDDQDYDGIAYVEDGLIYMAGGISYPQYSIEGIAIGEVLQAVANGEDIEAAALRVSREIEEMFSGFSLTPERGFYRATIPRWPDGIVNYYWVSGISSNYKPEIKKAMDDWTAGSNRKLKFVEITDNAWDWTLVVLGVKKIVKISEENLSNNAAGRAVLGAWIWGASTMKLDKGLPIKSTYTEERTVCSVSLHERGHVLGLEHEHQRADRDTYLTVTKTGDDYDRKAETWLTISYLAIETRYVKVLGIKIYYPVIVTKTRTEQLFSKTSSFDFNSIMIYDNLLIKSGYQNSSNGKKNSAGEWRTYYATQLSTLDKLFIQHIY